ncbi:MAG: glycerol-3-phosphate 1-O-acyltransferase PlsY [Victivallales bacterium]|jgi:glycerol-3-phosphate acyltransferase PlsY|nr:glycerol-3-phosphate 1-O-acyltransferase PlsY [Victivallales bacterium]
MSAFLLSGVVVFLCAYLLGSIPFGYLVGRFNGIDIRKYGSRNIGATNVTRVLGKGCGRFCFAGDFLKGVLAVLVVGIKIGGAMPLGVGIGWGGLIAAGACIIGHMYPFWLDFKGGKGVATSIGALAALAFWPLLIAVAVWYGLFKFTRIVSVASLGMALAAPLSALILKWLGKSAVSWHTIALMTGIAVMIFWRHRENIVRLMQGKENAFRK